MIKWTDGTSYSKSEKERIPRVWRAKIKTMDIIIHRIHGIPGWYLTSRYLNIKDYALTYEDIEQCKTRVEDIVKKSLYSNIREMQDILAEIG